MAKTPAKKVAPKKASVSEDAARANRERPMEPVPYKATKEELLEFSGTVTEVLHTAAGELLSVKSAEGREILVPFVSAIVTTVTVVCARLIPMR